MNNEFFQPKNLIQALTYKKKFEDAILLAGGTELVISMKKKKNASEKIIDLSKIQELMNIERQDNMIRIGSLVTFTDLIESEILQEKAPFMCEAAKSVGGPQIRNCGTIGGNICNANPAADGTPPLICLEAKLNLQLLNNHGEVQSRTLSMEEFVLNKNENALKNREILTSIDFKMPSNMTKMKFEKIGRRNAMAISRLNGACLLEIKNEVLVQIRLVIGAATSKPERLWDIEDYLLGEKVSEKLLEEVGRMSSDYVLKQTSLRTSSNYKLPVSDRFIKRLIKKTMEVGVNTDE